MNYDKLNQLLNTQAAIDAGIPGMNDTDAANWCNGNHPSEGASLLLCYVDIQVSDLSQYAGFERATRGNLSRALEKHRLGYGETPKINQLTDNDWRSRSKGFNRLITGRSLAGSRIFCGSLLPMTN